MPPPELETLVSEMLAQTGVAVVIDAVTGDLGRTEVPDVLWRRAELIACAHGRADFVRGRVARARACRRAGQTRRSCLTPGLPGADASLTHAGGWAFAAAAAAPRGRGRIGIGIDFEPAGRRIPRDAARFFLGSRELAELPPAGAADTDLLRLWTIKEACFKADPTNAGRNLRDYQVTNLGAAQGRVCHPSAFALHYASCVSTVGPISVAVALVGVPSPVDADVDQQEATDE